MKKLLGILILTIFISGCSLNHSTLPPECPVGNTVEIEEDSVADQASSRIPSKVAQGVTNNRFQLPPSAFDFILHFLGKE